MILGRARWALLWLAVIVASAGYVGLRIAQGLTFQTDLMALLPKEERDPVLSKVRGTITDTLTQTFAVMVGAKDRTAARAAAGALARDLTGSGIVSLSAGTDPEAFKKLGTSFFPYRAGLLSPEARRQLQAGEGQAIVDRALAQLYGMMGAADSRLLVRDPFLLVPDYFGGLPVPKSQVAPDEGMLAVEQDGIYWALLLAKVGQSSYALATQDQLIRLLDAGIAREQQKVPDLTVLRVGAVFYAHAGGQVAMRETSTIGAVSLGGTLLLILIVFRGIAPVWLGLLAIGGGILVAFALCLAIFGELHVAVSLFGVGLIGVSVDYSFQYCCERFNAAARTPAERMRNVAPGVAVGLAATLVGYMSFLLAPFPGLHQIASFSAIGLAASFLTVLAWFPLLDRMRPMPPPRRWTALGVGLLAFWENPRLRAWRLAPLALAATVLVAGGSMLTVDDDVRHFQALDPVLKRQEDTLRRLTGTSTDQRFFVVQGADMETVLQRQEPLIDRLEKLQAAGAMAGYRALAQFVPSEQRQRENRDLVRTALYGPYLAPYLAQIGMNGTPDTGLDTAGTLKPDQLPQEVANLLFPPVAGVEGQVVQLVTLDGVARAEELQAAARDLPGVRYLSPIEDFRTLFAEYRGKAVMLLGLSMLLMLPVLTWRYGWIGGPRALLPPVLAVVTTPAVLALCGIAFTFFNAMALVMVLSIGVDYAVFCLETQGERRPITLLAVLLSALTTILSFGLLAFSGVFAVKAFGATMLVGITLAFLLAPLAVGKGRRSYALSPAQVNRNET